MNTSFNTKDKKFLILLTPVILYFLLILNGVLGIDFGHHWDEWYFISQAVNAINTGTFLPSKYAYPSFCYFIVLSAANIYKVIFNIDNVAVLNKDYNFVVYLRHIFLMISSLTVVWVYWLTFKVSKNYLTALFAGLIILSSFEFSYHSRWAVTDAVAVQFAILSSLILFLDINRNKKIILSSLISGVAMGTKYTAAIVSLNILFFILIGTGFKKADFIKRSKELILFIIPYSIGFFITTPGAILDNGKFMHDVIVQEKMYSEGHIGHTVQAGISHFSKIYEYIIFELFSKNSIISIFIFLFSIFGLIRTLMKKQWLLSGMLVTMFIYIIYISSFKVMIVRNLLYVLPFFAIFASLGFYSLLTVIQNRKIKYFFSAIIILTLVYSGLNVFSASLSIYNKSKINSPKELDRYLKQNTDKHFVFSKKVLPMVEPEYKNTRPSEDSYLVFYLKEFPFYNYTANIRNQFVSVASIEDINLNYYPTWDGDDRIIIMNRRFAAENLLDSTFNEEDFAVPESRLDSAWSLNLAFTTQGIDTLSYVRLIFKNKLKAYIVNSEPPFYLIDSAKSKLDHVTLNAAFNFANRPSGEFYLVVMHNYSLKSWSKLPKLNPNENTFKYIFNVSLNQTPGDNMTLPGDSNIVYPVFSCDFEDRYIRRLDKIKLNNSTELQKICNP